MKKRRRQRFLSLMLVLCMIISAGMMTPLSTSANATDGYVTQETQQEDSALTGGAAADQTGNAATDIVTDTQEQTTTAGDIQTAEPNAVPEEAAASAAEQTDAGKEESNPAATESAAVTETPTDPVTVETQTDGAQTPRTRMHPRRTKNRSRIRKKPKNRGRHRPLKVMPTTSP